MKSKPRIAFICSCLEPGCNGVGDYTRNLAEECLSMGYPCAIISIKDHYVSQNPSKSHFTEDHVLNTIRFKDAFDTKESTESLQHFLKYFKPTIISLQFVPYGYQKKGLPFYLGRAIKKLYEPKEYHCMFHETWIGFHRGASWGDKIMGRLQKTCVTSLLNTLKPKCIHTTTRIYQKQLNSIHQEAKLLPLFGFIKRFEPVDFDAWLYPFMAEHGLPLNASNKDSYWLFGIFGNLPPIWPPYPLLNYIREASIANNKQPVLVHFGHMVAGQKLWNKIRKETASWLRMVELGPLLSSHVWSVFKILDYGIAVTPYSLIHKSASAASMVDSGLPVIVNRVDPQRLKGEDITQEPPPLVYKMSELLPDELPDIKRREPHSRLPEVARQFLLDIEAP